ncbi:MAG: dolichyl-phosphate beta-D-mannosyltransferase [Ignavibacteriae bacterium HGW-Ignavibacteriae-1]|jgi:dolichol-phosphate mannosyltransferase|nr:MAG: dolichyl-phosphate beta-D-mannosyltransferase [Ignavibacteriae bacterium HGW-Ignavibacteriae-1]
MKAIVVIPTYNELENIEHIVTEVLKVIDGLNVLVVDDNSPDGTADIVRKMMATDSRIHLIVRAGKMGLGTAYCEGFQYALDRGFEAIMEMDADFSHDPADLPRFLVELENHDLIIGSRYIKGVNVINWPLSRLILSYGANLYTRVITGMPVKDATGGFKCFRASKLAEIDLKSVKTNGYGFQIEMNYRMWKNGARIKEIPIIFIDRRSGTSKMNKSIIYEAIFLVWKLKLFSWTFKNKKK